MAHLQWDDYRPFLLEHGWDQEILPPQRCMACGASVIVWGCQLVHLQTLTGMPVLLITELRCPLHVIAFHNGAPVGATGVSMDLWLRIFTAGRPPED